MIITYPSIRIRFSKNKVQLPDGAVIDDFYTVTIPDAAMVNKKLSEILLQLHISEKSGRGVPRIVHEYGQQAFEFKDNAIVVTIPFNRLDLGDDPQIPHQSRHQTPPQLPL